MKKLYVALTMALIGTGAFAQVRSAKRGVCWDNKYQKINNEAIEKMDPGVSWFYNWGTTPESDASLIGAAEGMAFAPMCWNAEWNESAMDAYLAAHQGEVKYLLGYNEPNLNWTVGGSAMTPAQAAVNWSKVETMAAKYGLKLVAPALQFSGDKIGDRVWQPFEWLDAFITEYAAANQGRTPVMDCLSLHCYMNWAGALKGFATEYFYDELFNKAENNNKYGTLKQYLNDFKDANGHFPKMMLTEFCAYGENDGSGFQLTKESQIDQMTQKLQYLELSDVVEGYAWFMANPNEGYNSRPYNSLFESNIKGSALSELGQIYTYMSSFDLDKWYAPGDVIMAKDYIDASTDSQQVKLRTNSEEGSDIPLQCDMQAGTWTKYQIDVPSDGEYIFTIHMKSGAKTPIWFYLDGSAVEKPSVSSTGNAWQDYSFDKINVTAGQHTVMIYNAGSSTFGMNALRFASGGSGVTVMPGDEGPVEVKDIYGLDGTRVSTMEQGVYILRGTDGKTTKVIRK